MKWNNDDLLAAYRDERGPDEAARARLNDRRAQLVASPIDSDATTSTLAANQAPHDSRSRVPWWAVATLGLAAAIALMWWAQPLRGVEGTVDPAALAADQLDAQDDETLATPRELPSAPQTPRAKRPTPAFEAAPLDAPAVEAPPDEASTPELTEASAPTKPSETRRPARKKTRQAPVPRPADSVANEAKQIGVARAALARGNPQAALRELDAYDRRFAKGALREEAAALRTIARCRIEASHGAKLARTFHRRHAKSLFATQVDKACLPDE